MDPRFYRRESISTRRQKSLFRRSRKGGRNRYPPAFQFLISLSENRVAKRCSDLLELGLVSDLIHVRIHREGAAPLELILILRNEVHVKMAARVAVHTVVQLVRVAYRMNRICNRDDIRDMLRDLPR